MRVLEFVCLCGCVWVCVFVWVCFGLCVWDCVLICVFVWVCFSCVTSGSGGVSGCVGVRASILSLFAPFLVTYVHESSWPRNEVKLRTALIYGKGKLKNVKGAFIHFDSVILLARLDGK